MLFILNVDNIKGHQGISIPVIKKNLNVHISNCGIVAHELICFKILFVGHLSENY